MIGIIAALTLRQLLGRGRTILIGLVALLPILLALVYRIGSEDTNQQQWVAHVLFDGLIVTTLLPLSPSSTEQPLSAPRSRTAPRSTSSRSRCRERRSSSASCSQPGR